MSRAERQAKAVNWIAVASAVLAAVTVLAAAISLPILIDASGGIKAPPPSPLPGGVRGDLCGVARTTLPVLGADAGDLLPHLR